MHLAFIEDTKLQGGTQLWVHDAIHYFLKKKLKVTLITPEDGWLAEEFIKKGIKINVVTYNYELIAVSEYEFIDVWIQALSKCNVAICTVHPPRRTFHSKVFASHCIFKSNLKTVLVTKTGTIVPSYLKEYYLSVNNSNERIVTISKTIQDYLLQKFQFPKEKIQLIYQGINLDYFNLDREYRINNDFVKNFEKSNKSPILGCIGYLGSRKGQKFLIEAMSILASKIPNVHLLIVGDGPDKELLLSLSRNLNLENSITFIPFTIDPRQIYNIIDILILPSINKEGLPNVILEAFAMMVPVIATNIGGIAEIVVNYETGILIDPKISKQIENAVLELWDNKKLFKRIKNNSKRFILTNHDRNKQFSEYENYFTSLKYIK